MNLESTNLKEWKLNEVVSNTEQISNYAESTFVHLSGDDNIGSLQLSDNFVVGVGNNVINGQNSIAIGTNNTVYTQYNFAQGDENKAGTMSYQIVSGDADACTWKLKTTEGLTVGLMYSVRLINNYNMVGNILSVIDDTVISVDAMPVASRLEERLNDTYLAGTPFYDPTGNNIRAHYTIDDKGVPTKEYQNAGYRIEDFPPMSAFADVDKIDVNTLWIVGHPELGHLSSWSEGAHVEGYGCIAQKQYSHAEGNQCIASGKYSHAEGIETLAGYGAHAEGYYSKALENGSHAEGNKTIANAAYAHAEGTSTTASGKHSHAEGYSAIASGEDAHAEGKNTTASGDRSHAEGNATIASGPNSHSSGNGTVANGENSTALGLYSQSIDDNTLAQGYNVIAFGSKSIALGCNCKTKHGYVDELIKLEGSGAEGKYYEWSQENGFSEISEEDAKTSGKTIKTASYSNACKYANRDADLLKPSLNENIIIKLTNSGRLNSRKVISYGEPDNNAFVWNGISCNENVHSATYEKVGISCYQTHGNGTFNINPVKGVSGFYIGDVSLKTILDAQTANADLMSEYSKSKAYSELKGARIEQYLCSEIDDNYGTKFEVNGELSSIPNSQLVGSLNFKTQVLGIDETAVDTSLNNVIQIGKNITAIAANSFNSCSGLTGEMTIPDQVLTIGQSAFYNCTIESVDNCIGDKAAFKGSYVKKVTLRDSVTDINTEFAYVAEQLSTINLENVKTIGNKAFMRTALTAVSLDSIEMIGNQAFQQTNRLNEMHFPATLSSIGKDAFMSSTKSLFFDSELSTMSIIKSMDNYPWSLRTGSKIYCVDGDKEDDKGKYFDI